MFRTASTLLAAAALVVPLSSCSTGPANGHGTLDPDAVRMMKAIDAAHEAAPHMTFSDERVAEYVTLICSPATVDEAAGNALVFARDHGPAMLAAPNEGALDAAIVTACPKRVQDIETAFAPN